MSEKPLQCFGFVPLSLTHRLRNTHLKPSGLSLRLLPVSGFPCFARSRSSTGSFSRRHLLSPFQGSSDYLTIRRRPKVCSLSSRAAARIRLITKRHSLSSVSFTRTPDSVPCGFTCLSIQAEIRAYYVPHQLQKDNPDSFRTPAEQHSRMATL